MKYFEKCPLCEGPMNYTWKGGEYCMKIQPNFKVGCGFCFQPQKVVFRDSRGFDQEFESVEELMRWKKLEAFK